RLLLFADCAINVEPNSRELADIAIDTAETAKRFGIVPRVAMLSFSTAGSSRHPNADKVREAAQMVQHYKPELVCDGEMQVDAALVTEICKRKNPNAKVCGDANVLIFPNLDAANIAYKLVERLAKAHAVGPILQGLQKPVNDLSRGCSVEDIVNLAAITTLEVKEENYR
ncbi:MAG: phosphate acyltransferase, partial [Patescibacteria group bacterium]